MAEEQRGGTVVRGSDGTLYFIRDEILEQTKITEPEMKEFCEKLVEQHEAEVSGFGWSKGPVSSMLSFQGPFQAAGNAGNALIGSKAAGTVMCPGSMKDASFQINPASQIGM